jgi:hypothetical protein
MNFEILENMTGLKLNESEQNEIKRILKVLNLYGVQVQYRYFQGMLILESKKITINIFKFEKLEYQIQKTKKKAINFYSWVELRGALKFILDILE